MPMIAPIRSRFHGGNVADVRITASTLIWSSLKTLTPIAIDLEQTQRLGFERQTRGAKLGLPARATVCIFGRAFKMVKWFSKWFLG